MQISIVVKSDDDGMSMRPSLDSWAVTGSNPSSTSEELPAPVPGFNA